MKNTIKILILSGFIITMPLASLAQVTSPSDPGATPQGQPIGGGAPVGGGLFILLGLSAVYGGEKIYKLKKKVRKSPDRIP